MPTITIHCNSQSAIGRAQSNMYNDKSRHIRHRQNVIKPHILSGIVTSDYGG